MDMNSVSLNQPLTILMTDDSAYGHYLISILELLGKQAIPAAQKTEELLKERPPHA